MSIMQCVECNKTLSTLAYFCPHCGYPVKYGNTVLSLLSENAEICYDNGDVYTGYTLNGKKHGYGTYTWASEVPCSYSGEFKDDKPIGVGVFNISGHQFKYSLENGGHIAKAEAGVEPAAEEFECVHCAGNIRVSAYRGSQKSVKIPDTIYGYQVTQIGTTAPLEKNGDAEAVFSPDVEYVVLPQGLRRIGRNAFHGCKNLKRLDFSRCTLQRIEAGALTGCSLEPTIAWRAGDMLVVFNDEKGNDVQIPLACMQKTTDWGTVKSCHVRTPMENDDALFDELDSLLDKAGFFRPRRSYPLVDITPEDCYGTVMLKDIGYVKVDYVDINDGVVSYNTQTGETVSTKGEEFLKQIVAQGKNDEYKKKAIAHIVGLKASSEGQMETTLLAAKRVMTSDNCVLLLFKNQETSILCSTNLESNTTEVISEVSAGEQITDFCTDGNTIYYLTEEKHETEIKNMLYWRRTDATEWSKFNWHTGEFHPNPSCKTKMLYSHDLVFICCENCMYKSREQVSDAVFVVNPSDLSVKRILPDETIYEWEIYGDKIYYIREIYDSPDENAELASFDILTGGISAIQTGNMENLSVQHTGVFYRERGDYSGIFHNVMTAKGQLYENIKIDRRQDGIVLGDTLYLCEKIDGNEVLCRKNLLTGEEKTVLSVAHRRIGKVVFDRDYAVVEAFNITANGIPDEIMILNLSSGEVTRLSKRLIEKLLLENKKSKEKTESGNKNCQKAANIRNETASEEEMNKRGLYRVTFQGPKFISYRTFQGIPHTTSPDKKVIDGYVFIEPENDKQNSSKGYDPFYDSGHYWPQESDKLLDFLDYWDTGWAVEPIPEPELDYNDSHKNQDDYDT